MNMQRFNELLERRLSLSREVLASKSAEYSTDDDKLHNFKRSAELANESENGRSTPADECCGFMRKHIVSVFGLVNDSSKGGCNRRALIDEKIGDAINYLILLEALLVEEMR